MASPFAARLAVAHGSIEEAEDAAVGGALIELAEQITDKPPAREMDMLLSTGEQVTIALMAMAIDS